MEQSIRKGLATHTKNSFLAPKKNPPLRKITPRGNLVGKFLFQISVPIIVTLCVMFTYIVTGAVVYVVWENWTLTEATYFSFITLVSRL
jgi:pheromone shutdown protein TraB